jgi:hypothetical protein
MKKFAILIMIVAASLVGSSAYSQVRGEGRFGDGRFEGRGFSERDYPGYNYYNYPSWRGHDHDRMYFEHYRRRFYRQHRRYFRDGRFYPDRY